MTGDPFIPPPVWDTIDSQLDLVERQHDVRILLAVESGSRAWRFPSSDSDYDVRFIYVRPLSAYLSVEADRDVIEYPIDGAMDMNGWDLRKAFQLLLRSNAVLMEWLTSPIRYREHAGASDDILKLARNCSDLTAFQYHYDHLARRSFEAIQAANEAVSMKTYCYAVRPALALQWIRSRNVPPPMALTDLLDGTVIAESVHAEILDLIERKKTSTERDMIERRPAIDQFLSECLRTKIERGSPVDRSSSLASANVLFSKLVLQY